MLAVQHEIACEYITAAVVKLSCELILLCRSRSFTTGSACTKAAHAAGPIQTTEMQMPDGRAVAAGMLSVWRIRSMLLEAASQPSTQTATTDSSSACCYCCYCYSAYMRSDGTPISPLKQGSRKSRAYL